MLGGFDIVKEPTRVRAHSGCVPQMVSADGASTGRENLLLSAHLSGIPRAEHFERIEDAYSFMKLEDSGRNR